MNKNIDITRWGQTNGQWNSVCRLTVASTYCFRERYKKRWLRGQLWNNLPLRHVCSYILLEISLSYQSMNSLSSIQNQGVTTVQSLLLEMEIIYRAKTNLLPFKAVHIKDTEKRAEFLHWPRRHLFGFDRQSRNIHCTCRKDQISRSRDPFFIWVCAT